MSDNWVCIIPLDPNFVPTEDAVNAAAHYLDELAPDAEEISSDCSDYIKFRDCGGNLESIRCHACQSELPNEWWLEQMGEDEEVVLKPVSLPCGHVAASLNALDYMWDQGFSRFILEAMNPGITEISPSQLGRFEAILGCSVKVIYQHL